MCTERPINMSHNPTDGALTFSLQTALVCDKNVHGACELPDQLELVLRLQQHRSLHPESSRRGPLSNSAPLYALLWCLCADSGAQTLFKIHHTVSLWAVCTQPTVCASAPVWKRPHWFLSGRVCKAAVRRIKQSLLGVGQLGPMSQ